MKVRILGSGTSTGVPVPGCRCPICASSDLRNKRLRTSALIEIENIDRVSGDSASLNVGDNTIAGRILIDTSPDLRYQSLRENIPSLEAVLYTHTHADHVFGIDDLRSFNFINNSTIPLFASETSANELELRFPYAFFANHDYEGGAPPRLTLTRIQAYTPVQLFGVEIIPLPVWHGKMEVFGYRCRDFAYITDCSEIPERTREHLQGLEVLVLDGLRNRPHRTHFTHAQAVAEIEKLRPRQSYLTHISHEIDHETANKALRTMTSCPVELAYDGLAFSC